MVNQFSCQHKNKKCVYCISILGLLKQTKVTVQYMDTTSTTICPYPFSPINSITTMVVYDFFVYGWYNYACMDFMCMNIRLSY